MSTLQQELALKIRAGVPGLLVASHEHEDALAEITALCAAPGNNWRLMTFDVSSGTEILEEVTGSRDRYKVPGYFEESIVDGRRSYVRRNQPTHDPGAAIAGLPGLNESVVLPDGQGEVPAILVMINHQRWINTATTVQLIANRLTEYKQHRRHIVLLSCSGELPLELQKLFEAGHVRHHLPDRQEVQRLITQVCDAESVTDMEQLVDSCMGLTRSGVENALALALCSQAGPISSKAVFDLKAEAFRSQSKAIEICRSSLSLADYGGAPFLKEFCTKLLAVRRTDAKLRPRGVFLLGPPGVGKTHFAKCLGNTVGRPTAICRLAAVKSRWQGVAGEQMNGMLQTLDAMAPAIAFFDEVEGQVSGGKDTGATDGGVKAELNSAFLEWTSERTSDVFAVMSSNDIRPIMRDMPEFARLGRFDGLFFLDYPDRAGKDEIWRMYLTLFGFIQPDNVDEGFERIRRDLPKDDLWTGAEILACCRLSALLEKPLKEVGKTMPTIAQQAADRLREIREWADGRCYAAEYDGLYRVSQHAGILEDLAKSKSRRSVIRRSPGQADLN